MKWSYILGVIQDLAPGGRHDHFLFTMLNVDLKLLQSWISDTDSAELSKLSHNDEYQSSFQFHCFIMIAYLVFCIVTMDMLMHH